MAGSAKMNDYGKATVKAGLGAPIRDLMPQKRENLRSLGVQATVEGSVRRRHSIPG
jgi:hypothetical protein